MTPEGKVKAAVKRFLKRWDVWADWPVPSGFGKSTLDCQIIANGQTCWIETKAPGGTLTPRQLVLKAEFERHGVDVFVIDKADVKSADYAPLELWLERYARNLRSLPVKEFEP